MQRLGREGRELEVGALDVAIEEHQAREVDRAVVAEDLVFIEFEVDAEAFDDLGVGAGFDFETHGIAFAAVVELDANGFKQRARFFFFEVEVGVAGDAEGGAGLDFVAAIHAAEVLRDEVLEKQVVEFAVFGGEADEAGKSARDSDDAEDLRAGAFALAAKQQGEAERFVEDARKGMRGIDGDGGEKRIDFALEIGLGVGAGFFVEFIPLHEANALFAEFGEQEVVPAAVLGFDEGVDFGGEGGERLIGTKAVVALLAVAVFNALHEAGLADFHIFVKVGTGNGEKLDPFEERIGGVFSFFEDAAIELHPGVVASGKELLFLFRSGHEREYKPCWQVYSVLQGNWNRPKLACPTAMVTEMGSSKC